MMMTSPLLQFNSNIIGLVVLVSCAVTYFLMQLSVKHRLEAMRQLIENAIAIRPESLPLVNPEASVMPAATPVSEVPKSIAKPTTQPVATTEIHPSGEELAHESLVVIAAAVSAFLGKSVRLRSARLAQPSEGNAWAQQGRVFVQASHNLGLAPRLHG
jgi:methylmalonyl-CoA carboxyltransferase large subunit